MDRNADNFTLILNSFDLTLNNNRKNRQERKELLRAIDYRFEFPGLGLFLPQNEKWTVHLRKFSLLNRVQNLVNGQPEDAVYIRLPAHTRPVGPIYPQLVSSFVTSASSLLDVILKTVQSYVGNTKTGLTMGFDNLGRLKLTVAKDVQFMMGLNLAVALGFFFVPGVQVVNYGGFLFILLQGSTVIVSILEMENVYNVGGSQFGKIMLDIADTGSYVGKKWDSCLGCMPLRSTDPHSDNFITYESSSGDPIALPLNSSYIRSFNIKVVDELNEPVTVSMVNPRIPSIAFELDFKKSLPWND